MNNNYTIMLWHWLHTITAMDNYKCYGQLYGAMAFANLRFTIDVLCRTMRLRFKNSGFADVNSSIHNRRTHF